MSFDDEGLYHVKVSNTLGYVESTPALLTAMATSSAFGYDLWAMQLPVGQRARHQQNSGVVNLLRYALGGSLHTPKAQLSLNIQLITNGSRLSFNRIADPTLTYEIWQSVDIVDWGNDPIWSSSGAQNLAGEVFLVDPNTLSDSANRFFRLHVK